MKKTLRLLPLLLAVCLSGCKIQSAEEYRSETLSGPLHATIEIRCDVLLGQDGVREEIRSLLPEDGVLLAESEYGLPEGAAAYTLLEQAAKAEDLTLSVSGSGKSVYIAAINGIAAQACGELSGWMFEVNGEFPSSGCGGYELSEGDAVRFLYTCDMGRDLS